MDKEYCFKRYMELLKYLPYKLKDALKNIDYDIVVSIQEIRLRCGRPLTVTVGGSQFFVGKNHTSMIPKSESIIVTESDMEECFLNLCNHSVYSHEEELKEGFLILKGGHRAGICGHFSVKNGVVEGVRDISSINIRIAKEVTGCAENIINIYKGGGVLVCGGPGSGKTTVIRDMVRLLSSGATGKCLKVAVIDSRGEIAAVSGGKPMTDLGSTSDIITACPKGKGIEMALRTLYPDVIVFDELGSMDEVRAIEQSLNSGVGIITSVHLGELKELYIKAQTRELLKIGAVENVVMCSNKNGFTYTVYSKSELNDELMQGASI